MEKNKKTKKELFTELMAIEEVKNNPEQMEFIGHELELLNKKHNPGKPTKAQEENGKLQATISEVLGRIGKPVTISDLQKEPELENFSNQKISALIRLMVISEKVIRTEVKRVAYFEV